MKTTITIGDSTIATENRQVHAWTHPNGITISAGNGRIHLDGNEWRRIVLEIANGETIPYKEGEI